MKAQLLFIKLKPFLDKLILIHLKSGANFMGYLHDRQFFSPAINLFPPCPIGNGLFARQPYPKSNL
jgi:hypothetical protein